MSQIKNIPLIIKELIQCNLIKEIGMPLEYAYKMKSLLLFLKPVNVQLHKSNQNIYINLTTSQTINLKICLKIFVKNLDVSPLSNDQVFGYMLKHWRRI